ATPLAFVVCVVVPLSVPVPGAPGAIAIEAPGTLLPNESCAWTDTKGVVEATSGVLVGCCTNASDATAPTVIVNELLTADLLLLDAVSVFEPVRLMLRLLKVATPLLSVVCVAVPLSTPVPGAPVSAIAMETPGTLLPKESCAL